MTFTLDGRLYGVDVDAVQEVLRGQPRTRIPLAPGSVAGLINLRGQVLSAIDLRARLGLPARDAEHEPMLVVDPGRRRAGRPARRHHRRRRGRRRPTSSSRRRTPCPARSRELLLGAYKLDDQLLLALDVDRAVAA